MAESYIWSIGYNDMSMLFQNKVLPNTFGAVVVHLTEEAVKAENQNKNDTHKAYTFYFKLKLHVLIH